MFVAKRQQFCFICVSTHGFSCNYYVYSFRMLVYWLYESVTLCSWLVLCCKYVCTCLWIIKYHSVCQTLQSQVYMSNIHPKSIWEVKHNVLYNLSSYHMCWIIEPVQHYVCFFHNKEVCSMVSSHATSNVSMESISIVLETGPAPIIRIWDSFQNVRNSHHTDTGNSTSTLRKLQILQCSTPISFSTSHYREVDLIKV